MGSLLDPPIQRVTKYSRQRRRRRAGCQHAVSVGDGSGVRLRNEPQVRLCCLPAARKLLTGLLVRDRRDNDYVLALPPVDRCGDRLYGGELERVEEPEDLVEVSPAGHRI